MAALLSLLLAVSCTGAPAGSESVTATVTDPPSAEPTPSVQPVTDLESFVQALEAAGFAVREGERTDADLLFAVPTKAVFIGDARVSAYEYPSEEALDDVRASIGRDGYSVPTRDGIAHVDWVATPHFFRGGRLLVLYVGDARGALEALELVLGPQFAGG